MQNLEAQYLQKTDEELQSIDDGLDRNGLELSPEKVARRKQIRKILAERSGSGVIFSHAGLHHRV